MVKFVGSGSFTGGRAHDIGQQGAAGQAGSLVRNVNDCGVRLVTAAHTFSRPFDQANVASKLLFAVTGAIAEFERDMIAQRVNPGLARARANGVTLGRPKIDKQTEEAIRKAVAKGDKGKHIAAECGVGSSTVARIKAEMEAGA